MPLGDSITDGYTPDNSAPGGYRLPLYQLLTNGGFTFDFVGTAADNSAAGLPYPNHEGHSGYRIDQINSGFLTWVNSINSPDIILLLIGTNDYGQNYDTPNAINRLDGLISNITSNRPNAKLIVANVTFRTGSVDSLIQSTFNPYLPGLVASHAARGEQVYFVDMRSALLAADLIDGLHPNQGGYNKMAGQWFNAIKNLISTNKADAAMDVFNAAYLVNTNGLKFYATSLTNRTKDYFWCQALDIQGLEDTWERTHSAVHRTLISNMLNAFLVNEGSDWSWNGYNDDLFWATIAFVRGYQATGNTNFLNQAAYGFNLAYNRGWDTNFGGGIWWSTDKSNKNILSNDPGIITACYLYDFTGDTTYLNKAQAIYAWVRGTLYNTNTGAVYGSISSNGVVDTSTAVFNQGAFVGAANHLHQITGQHFYFDDAVRAVEYVRNNSTQNGILSNSTRNGTWASELARGLGEFVRQNNLWSTYYPWMLQNVNATWNDRQTNVDLTWNSWLTPTPNTNTLRTLECVSAVVMLQVTPTSQPGFVACTNQLTGAVIGTAGSFGGGGNTIAKVFDNNLNTFFDAPVVSGAWVGLDFGADESNVIGQINYWPRATFSGRMLGGIFQGDNLPTFTNPVILFTIATAPPENGIVTSQTITNTTRFRCVRYVSPANGWCSVAEMQFFTTNPPPPIPAAPANLLATSGLNQIALNWNAAANAAGYNVKRAFSNGGPYSLIVSNLSGTNWTDAGLAKNLACYYVVSALNVSGESGNSAAASATTRVPASIILTNSDAANTTSFNAVGNWNGGGAPTAASDYSVLSNYILRSPTAGNAFFPGNSLTLASGSIFAFKTGGTITFGTNAVKGLFLDGGWVGLWQAGPATVSGFITLNAGGGGFDPQLNAPLIVSAQISGPGFLKLDTAPGNANTGGTLILTASNSYTGGTVIDANMTLKLTNAATLGATTGTLSIINTNGRGHGILDLNGTSQAIGNLIGTGGQILNHNTNQASVLTVGNSDAGGGTFQGVIADGNGRLTLIKKGDGTITLSGANTFTGSLVVGAGTLALTGSGAVGSTNINIAGGATLDVTGRTDRTLTLGSGKFLRGGGTLLGKLNAAGGSTINPGDAIGTLVVQSNITLAGTVVMDLNRANAQPNDKFISTNGTISGGGILKVNNLGQALQGGDVFRLFNQPVSGFSTVSLPVLPSGNVWQNNLAADGSIRVVSTNAVNLTIGMAANQLTLAWPVDHVGWRLQTQTNDLMVGLSINWFDVVNATVTNQMTLPVLPMNSSVFFRLIFP